MSLKDGLKAAGFFLELTAIVSVGIYGVYRAVPELQDTSRITPGMIEVTETYGFFANQAQFFWSAGAGTPATITFSSERNTIDIKGPCDREIVMASYSGLEPSLDKAGEDLAELCGVLDCDGICSEWKRVNGEQQEE